MKDFNLNSTGQNEHHPWDIWTFWVSNAMMIIMLCISVPATIYAFKKSKFRWVKMMFSLCVMQNVSTIYLSFGDYYE